MRSDGKAAVINVHFLDILLAICDRETYVSSRVPEDPSWIQDQGIKDNPSNGFKF